jgi:hypothetical protein
MIHSHHMATARRMVFVKAAAKAFSSEVDAGSREENASKQKTGARSELIRTEKARGSRMVG